jgi:hypothetical protein
MGTQEPEDTVSVAGAVASTDALVDAAADAHTDVDIDTDDNDHTNAYDSVHDDAHANPTPSTPSESPDEPTVSQYRINPAPLITAIVLGIISGLILFYYINSHLTLQQQISQLDKYQSMSDEIYYAYDFRMQCTHNPMPSSNSDFYVTYILQDIAQYSKIEFVIEVPRYDRREKGTLYFSSGGGTQTRLYNLNINLALQNPDIGSDIGFPVTLDSLINDRQAVMAKCGGVGQGASDSPGMTWGGNSDFASLKSGLYAKVFLFQTDEQQSEQAEPDFMTKLNVKYATPIIFSADPPGDYPVDDGTVYFYPNQQGHTLTLIDNLNIIIAENPELLDDSDLVAPLTLENIVNDRNAVWQIVNQLDARQIAQFRAH